MDRIELIKELQNKTDFKNARKPSVVVNNFFSLITIVIVTIVIILYVNFYAPAQKANKIAEIKLQKKIEYQELRTKQIALSHKLNDLTK